MKLITILNKIANNKKVPRKIKVLDETLLEEYRVWIWEGLWYIYDKDGKDVCIELEYYTLSSEVEILER